MLISKQSFYRLATGFAIVGLLTITSLAAPPDAETALVSDAEGGSLSTQQNSKGKGNGKPSQAGITVSQIETTSQGLVTSEIGDSAPFDVVLESQPTADVTIELESSDPTEGTADVASLTFTPDNWDIAQMVIVTGVQDAYPDGAIDYQIVIGPANSDDTTTDLTRTMFR